jgi:iron complex transport system substrate-binding protein
VSALLAAGIGAILSAAAHAQSVDAAHKPHRIVSLNLCSDELVLRLADRDDIASVTWLSRDPNSSNVADLAAQVPVNHGLAEEVVPLAPDLVIAGTYTTRTAVAFLRRMGVRLVELDVPRSMDQVLAQIREVAQAVGEPERGERMIAAMEGRLAALSERSRGKHPRALVLNPNGFTSGPGSLVDKIITAAGLTNLAAGLDVGNDGRIPLETVAVSGVDVLILNGRRDEPPSLATELLRHPVLAKLPHLARLIVLPSRLWTCGGPAIVEAAERLAGIATDAAAPTR